jgi:IS5 family transposase
MGHVLVENRNGLVVDHYVSISTATTEPQAAVEMVGATPGNHRITVGMDRGYDRGSCVKNLRQLNATPHVAKRKASSAIDRRTARHVGYTISQRVRKRVEVILGWMKTVGGYRKTRFRGVDRVGQGFTLAMTAYNMARLRNLMLEKGS